MAAAKKSARHASALKATRQNERRRVRNRKNLGQAKSALRAERALVAKGAAQEALAKLPETVAAIDKAVAKGVMHKNAAARRKSRLQKKLNELSKTK